MKDFDHFVDRMPAGTTDGRSKRDIDMVWALQGLNSTEKIDSCSLDKCVKVKYLNHKVLLDLFYGREEFTIQELFQGQ